ncbi:MAG TPA: hypothetical protein VIH93_00500, partial [Thermoanaerobaculia bacterium]
WCCTCAGAATASVVMSRSRWLGGSGGVAPPGGWIAYARTVPISRSRSTHGKSGRDPERVTPWAAARSLGG